MADAAAATETYDDQDYELTETEIGAFEWYVCREGKQNGGSVLYMRFNG